MTLLDVTVNNGKYRVVQHDSGEVKIFRHGEPWCYETGNNLVLSLAQAVAQLTEAADHLRVCRYCAEEHLEDCEGGRQALAALKLVETRP